MAKTAFVLGKGTKVEIALLPVGERAEPVRITSMATGTTETAKGVTSITVAAALPEGALIPAKSYLAFVNPTSGKQVLVQLTADAKAGDTTLKVVATPEVIAPASTTSYPPRLSGRTGANLDRSGNRTSTVDFESDGYSDGLTTSIEQTISCDGNWLPQDAGFATAEHAFTELAEVYVWLELPKISAAYSKGRVYHGPTSINSLPLEIPADGIITGNIELAFNGRPSYEPDTPAA